MPRRPAAYTQGDVERMIRAAKAAGLIVVRIVKRPDGFSVETSDAPPPPSATELKPTVVL